MEHPFKKMPLYLRRIVYGLGALALLVAVFAAGVSLGSHSARFDARYFRPSDGRGPLERLMPELPGGHGASGTVVSVSGAKFVIAEKGGSEKSVAVDPRTIIHRFRSNASTSDVSVGDSVIVLGSPDTDGIIHASLVRIIPSASSTAAQ